MADMTLTDGEIKTLLSALPKDFSGTVRLVVILDKLGITSPKEVAELAGVSDRMVRHARKQIAAIAETDCREGGNIVPETETDCQNRKQASEAETDCRPRVRTRARFETPSGLSSSEEIEIDTPLPSVGPPADKPKRNGTRLPEDWTLPDDWRQWARINYVAIPAETVQFEADKFRDFWVAKTGRGSTMRDWQATWRNWCRKAFGAPGKGGQPINWGRSAYDQRPPQPKGIDWDAVDARVAELDRRSQGARYHA